MTVVFVTGMSGVGKYGGWIEDHERSGEPLFLAGTVVNQGRFYPRFAGVDRLEALVRGITGR